MIGDCPLMSLSDGMQIDQTVEKTLAVQKGNLLLWAPVCFGIGVACYFGLRFEPKAYVAAGILVAALILFFFAGRQRFKNIWRQIAWLAAAATLLGAAGFADAQFRTATRGTTILARAIGPVNVQGIVETAEDQDTTSQITLSHVVVEHLAPAATPKRVRLKVRVSTRATTDANDFVPEMDIAPLEISHFRPGDYIRVLARLSPPAAPSSPGAFDFQRYAWYRRIGAFGFTYGAPVIVNAAAPSGIAQHLERVRQIIAEHIDKAMTAPAAGIAKTLIVQARGAIAPADEDAMRAAGLAHLLAIAGLHLSIVAGFIFFGIRLLLALSASLALHRPIKKYAAAAAFMGALIYTLLAGAPVPTVRAMIMSGVVLLAILLDRLAISARLVALAALTILIAEPEVLTGPSFQLSFAAVTALIVIYDRLTPWWTRVASGAGFGRRAVLYFFGICLTTLIASVATAPFSVYQFQTFNPYGVLGNLLAIPLMAYWVMPAAVVACLAMPFGLDRWPLQIMAHGILPILRIAHWVFGLPHSTLALPAMPIAALIMTVLAGAIALFWRGRGAWAGLLPLTIAVILLFRYQPPDILIAPDAKLMAVRDMKGGYVLSSHMSGPLRGERLASPQWTGWRIGALACGRRRAGRGDAMRRRRLPFHPRRAKSCF